jgi:transposase
MADQAVYVGVDVSKERFDLAVWPGDEFFSVANEARAIKRLLERLEALNCTRIVLAASGGYETLVAGALWAAGLPVVIVNPRRARALRPGYRAAGQERSPRRPDAGSVRHAPRARGACAA